MPKLIVIDRGAIRKDARKLLKNGASKQEAFGLLLTQHKSPGDIAAVLNNIPSAKALESTEYGTPFCCYCLLLPR